MRKLFIAIGLVLALNLAGQEYASCPLNHYTEEVYKNPLYADYLSKYDVKFYHIDLEVTNQNTFIEGSTGILVEVLEPLDTLVFQLIDALEVSEVLINQVSQTTYVHDDDALYIPYSATIGEELMVDIAYQGDASQDRGFFAGISSSYDAANKQQVTYTLSEPLNARDWFPVKQVLEDKVDSVWVEITCDQGLMVGSNGLLTEVQEHHDGTHTFLWKSHYPMAYYLISLSVANYMDYSFYVNFEEEGDSLLVQNFIYNDEDYLATWKDRIDDTGDMIKLFSDLVIRYPFMDEKYGHSVAPMGGGMEHQTMTTLANFNFNLVSHELAHQWFGDHITCGNWQDIWINEGFATYFNYLALEFLRSKEEADDWMEYSMTLAMGASGSVYVPEEDAEDEYRVFDYALSYKKGAVLLHMIRYEINNDSVFFQVMKEYSKRYGNSVATAADFMEVLKDVSGIDFSCFFDQWYYGEGYPEYRINWYQSNDTLFVRSLQEGSSIHTPLFKMHFDLVVETGQGRDTLRLYQDENEVLFTIPMTEQVLNTSFDPDHHLLARAVVEMTIPQLAEGKLFVLGPNPSKEELLLKFRELDVYDIQVFDMEGKLVLTDSGSQKLFTLDVSSLSSGYYIIKVLGNLGIDTEKFLKLENL